MIPHATQGPRPPSSHATASFHSNTTAKTEKIASTLRRRASLEHPAEERKMPLSPTKKRAVSTVTFEQRNPEVLYQEEVEKEAIIHSHTLASYVFFRQILISHGAKDLPEDLTRSDVEKWCPRCDQKVLLEWYEEELQSRNIDPKTIRKKTIRNLEVRLQAAHNLMQVAGRLHEQYPRAGTVLQNFFSLQSSRERVKEIVRLDLSGLSLTWLPKSLQSIFFTELRELDLSKNLFLEIPPQFFPLSHHLRKLNFSQNRIGRIAPDLGEFWWELEEIELQGNRLSHIPPSVLKACTELKKLDISENPIHLLRNFGDFWPNLEALHV